MKSSAERSHNGSSRAKVRRGWGARATVMTAMDQEKQIKRKWKGLSSRLGEREARLWAATEAKAIGQGGVSMVSRATGLARSTIRRGLKDLVGGGNVPAGRQRRNGAGRKRVEEVQEGLEKALDALIEPQTRGDPQCPLRWCSKSTMNIARELNAQGFRITAPTVARLWYESGYTLQRTRKTREGSDHPDRNAQFERISELVSDFQTTGDPVISVDTKKKEIIGNYGNDGHEWQPTGEPVEVKTHDFIDPELGKAIPYGVYDVGLNKGFVKVGVTHDTPEFAVAAIRRWWSEIGKPNYPKAKRLLITADCGGSNGNRVRAWKMELSRFARDVGIDIRVAHFPPGTSKWNKIEHRMFCHITHNWRGRPLISREVIVNLIGSTRTEAGLQVKAELDDREYSTGIKISDKDFKAIPIKRDDFHGEWNYILPAT